jgi:hypothetical protein
MTGGRASAAGSLAGPATALAVVVGVLLLVWAATAGPPRVFEPVERETRSSVSTASPTATPSDDARDPLADLRRDRTSEGALQWVFELVAWVGVIAAGFLVGMLARAVWRARQRRPPPPADVDFDVLPAADVARAIAEDAAARLEAIDEGGPRNAIVRCWLLLEESAASAGVARQRHETSTEFTVRVLHRVDVDPAAIGALARLYREARFSDHDLGEDAREAARDALRRLHDDLARAGATA